MVKSITKIYYIFLAGVFLLFIYMLISYRLDIYGKQDKGEFQIITLQENGKIDDAKGKVHVREKFVPSGINEIPAGTHLVFMTIHQEVEVLVNGNVMYSMKKFNKLLGKTPGCVVNDVLLTEDVKGEDISIELLPVYKSSIGSIPKTFLGSRHAIYSRIIMDELPGAFLGVIAVICGVLFVGYVHLNRLNTEVDSGIQYLGAFAAVLGCWKISDGWLLRLTYPASPAVAAIPFLALGLATIPLVLFFRDRIGNEDSKLWNLICMSSAVEYVFCIAMQISGILDFRQTFYVTIVMMLLSAMGLIYMIASEIRKKGFTEKQKKNVQGMMLCFASIGLDMGTYFLSGGKRTTILGMCLFLFYIFSRAYAAIQEARELAAIGEREMMFEEMAFRDPMTKLLNRSAYARDMEREDHLEHAVVYILDLNNLKKCNDTLGHEMGDVYINDSAKLIADVFKDFGNVYRIGGDEFACISLEKSYDECKKIIKVLDEEVEKYNGKNNGIPMGIAVGYARYDSRVDYKLYDTVKRADEMMYKDKEKKKAKALKNN